MPPELALSAAARDEQQLGVAEAAELGDAAQRANHEALVGRSEEVRWGEEERWSEEERWCVSALGERGRDGVSRLLHHGAF